MADAIFATDRGYNCKQSIEFVSNKLGSTCFGNHKRSLDFPFVFGEGPIRKRHKGMVVSEKGCRAIYSDKQRIRSRYSRRQVQASVYRESFSGRIADVYSNNERMLSSTKFKLVPREAFRGNVDAPRMKELGIVYDLSVAAENSAHSSQITSLGRLKLAKWYGSVTHLTYFQSQDPAWFLLREFVFSSRTASIFFRETATSFDENLNALLQLLCGIDLHPYGAQVEHESHIMPLQRDKWDAVITCIRIKKTNFWKSLARH